MERFYHKARFYKFSLKHKTLIVIVGFVAFLVVYLAPLFPYIPTAVNLIVGFTSTDNNLSREGERTNILLLGLDGRRESLGSNTDTIIFASVDRAQKQNLMLSIPRDLWVADLGTKVNNAYPSGNKIEGNGLETAKASVSSIVGQPIHYSLAVSLDGFVKIVDILGGVDVAVDRSFVDDSYPIAGLENDLCNGDPKTLCRWEILDFKKGLNHFDGATALKFARSRHSRGEEGTDFARAERQQKIIAAVKKKIFSPEFLFNPTKIKQMLEIVNAAIDTDIPPSDYASLAKLTLFARSTPLRSEIFPWDESVNLDGGLTPKSGILYHPEVSAKYNNEWVLLPIGDSYAPIHSWVKCLISGDDCNPEDFVKMVKRK